MAKPDMQAIVEAARARLAARQAQAQAASAAQKIAENDKQAKAAGVLPAMNWGRKGEASAGNIVDASKVSLVLSKIDNASVHASGAGAGEKKLDFNPEQLAAIELGLQGKSFCLIGAAGTGKTTVTQELISRVQRAAHMMPLSAATKHLAKDAPGIVVCGFTNKAVNNIRKRLPEHLQKHCITIHKLLEYAPVYYEVPDPLLPGKMTTTMRFEATRNGANPLPHISTIIFEESSMIGTDLFDEVQNALPLLARTQFIFLGDLNQLPPVFGPSILGFKLAELRTIELTHVYRQALLSPIISIATAIRTNQVDSGLGKRDGREWHERDTMVLPRKLEGNTTVDRNEHGKLTVHTWKKRVEWEAAIHMMKVFLPKSIENGVYNPAEDMILCPFNKSFGTIELNNIIADYLGKKNNQVVHEVIARYEKRYFAVGDRVLHDRHEAIITEIYPTPGYSGKVPQIASKTLNRWGFDPESGHKPNTKLSADEVLNALDALAGADDDAKNLASHTIKVRIPDLDKEETLNTAGTINQLLFGWALTVHKSQGSEWEKVFFFLHNSHATMLSRELVYTAVTRAKHELYVICEGDIGTYTNSLVRAAGRPVIPGTTLAEKIAYFRGKSKERGRVNNEEME